MNYRRNNAMNFIILMGVVSLFGDITYEGSRSVTGPYMAFLGASAAMVGFVSGLGELLGYALRLFSGFLADKTKAYWPLTFLGYGLIFAIPFLGFTGNWQMAAVLIVLERIGKAVRSPARDAILSYATKQVGRGWGFAVHEAMDQVGAIAGPLIFSAVFFLKGTYRQGFLACFVPAVLTIIVLIAAKVKVSAPENMEEFLGQKPDNTNSQERLSKVFWLYTLFTFLCVTGFANFQVISYHFKAKSIISDIQIPIFYMIAMAVDGAVALAIGKAYDKVGLKTIILAPILTMLLPFFGFSYSYVFAAISVVIWGAVMGIHETIMRAAIADLTHINKRGAAYGIFNTAYGAAWFLGSLTIGFLYWKAPVFINVFVVMAQILAIIIFSLLKKDLSLNPAKVNS